MSDSGRPAEPDWFGPGWRPEEPGGPAAGPAGTVEGIIETLTSRTERLPAPRLSTFRRALGTELAPLLSRVLIFGLMIYGLYRLMATWTGTGTQMSVREYAIVAVLVFLLYAVRGMFGRVGGMLIGAPFWIAGALSQSLRRILELMLLGDRDRPRETTVYDITTLDVRTGQNRGVRLYGRLAGAPLAVGHRVTFNGVRHGGVLLAWDGVNHTLAQQGREGRFHCTPPRR